MKNNNNSSLLILSTCFVILLNSVEAVTQFKVGDDFGWQAPNNTLVYDTWATSHRFHIGDTLMFEYKDDSVIEVDKWGYYHCNRSNSIIEYDNGKSFFNLDKQGPFYFISGNPEHCRVGQRLLVQVMHPDHSSPPSPPSPLSPALPPDQFNIGPSPVAPHGGGALVSVGFGSILLGFVVSFMV